MNGHTVAVPFETVETIVQALDTITAAACRVSVGLHDIADLTRGGAPIVDDEPGQLADVVDLARYRNTKRGGAA